LTTTLLNVSTTRCYTPYARGRLVITLLGDGRFTVEITQGADKWEIRA
jgi:hypothetical protein